MDRTLPGLVILAVTFSAAHATEPGFYQSFLVDTTPYWLPVDSVEDSPALAFDGVHYLAVWQIRRGSDWNICAARVSQSGQVLDKDGLVVSAAPREQLHPAVAFDGVNYLVVWEDHRSGSRWDIYGARVDTAGRVLDPDGFAARADLWVDARLPAVAGSAGRCLVAWEEYHFGWGVFGSIVDDSGRAGDEFRISDTVGPQRAVSVTRTSDGYLAAWQDSRNGYYPQTYCARVDSSGIVLDTAGVALWTDRYAQERPSACWDGENTLVTWEEGALLDTDIYGARLSASGVVMDSVPLLIGAGRGRQTQPRAVRRPLDRLVVWTDTRDTVSGADIYAARVFADGTVRDPFGLPIVRPDGEQGLCCVAAGDTQTLVGWRDRSGDTLFPDIYACRMSAEDSVLDPSGFRLADPHVPMYYGQARPAVGSNGECYLVVWTDLRKGAAESDIRGILVGTTGEPLDSVSFNISDARKCQDSAAVASDGNDFLVVWHDNRDGTSVIRGARVSGQGALIDTAGFTISRDSVTTQRPSVARDGRNYVVVWIEFGSNRPVLASRVSSEGTVLDTVPIDMSPTVTLNRNPAVASADSLSLVVWQTYSHGWDITGARVSSTGDLLDSNAIVAMSDAADQFQPSVCCNGTDFLVTFQEWQTGAVDIFGTRVGLDGAVKDTYGFAISRWPSHEELPVVASTGSGAFVAWLFDADSTRCIRGARIGLSGNVADTFTLVERKYDALTPALGSGPTGQVLLVYSSKQDTVGGRPAGVQRIAGLMSPFGGVEEESNDGRAVAGGCPTIVRGVLDLTSLGKRLSVKCAQLLDVQGRHVMPLAVGLNRVEQLRSGVYFVRLEGEEATTVLKVVLER